MHLSVAPNIHGFKNGMIILYLAKTIIFIQRFKITSPLYRVTDVIYALVQIHLIYVNLLNKKKSKF